MKARKHDGPSSVAAIARATAIAIALVSLVGCNALDRLSDVGSEPTFTPLQNPVADPEYQQVSLPMPAPVKPMPLANSLWRPGARAFFKDQRAGKVGDILTLVIDIDDKGELRNVTKRSRKSTEDAAAARFFGYEASFDRVLPEAVNAGNLVDLDSETSNTGDGSVVRDEDIEMKIAVVVTDVLPNGNLAIFGRQEIRLNFEMRVLSVGGVVRPEDISSTNTINSDQVAEAHISYSGRGQITDIQQPRYGQQIYDIIFPF